MKNTSTTGYWLTASIIPVLCIIVEGVFHLTNIDGIELLGLSTATLDSGQYWRLASANFIHTNTTHTLMNIAGFYLLFAWCTGRWPPSLFSLFTVSGGALGLLLLSLWLTIDWYAGLSCALHALLVLVAASTWKRDRFLSLAIAVLTVIKVGFEAWQGGDTLSSTLIDAPVFWQSHVTGVVAGIILSPVFLFLSHGFSTSLD